jgi:hypothetical protein
MLLPYTTLTYYGPGAASMALGDGAGIGSMESQPVMTKRTGATIGGVGTANVLRPYRGRVFRLAVGGVGAMASQPRKRNRFALSVSIGGALTQDGVTGAVLESKVEGDLTLKQAIRILLSHAAGDATGLEGASPAFKSLDGSKTRIAGTYASGTRNVTTLDGS